MRLIQVPSLSLLAARQVLIVDDEPDIREMMVMWLRDDERCASVLQAGDLDSAVEIIEQQSPDAVLLDFFLGSRISVEELPRMRLACPTAVIVVYTASPEDAQAAGVLEAGANLLLEKGQTDIDEVVELLLSTPLASTAGDRVRRDADEQAG